MKISRSSTIIFIPLAKPNHLYRVAVISNFTKFNSLLAPKDLFKKERFLFFMLPILHKEGKFKAKVKTIISFNKNQPSSLNLNFTLGFKNYLFLKEKIFYACKSNYSTGDNSSNLPKDKFHHYLSLSSSIKYLNKYEDFSFKNRKMIKEKYYKKRGIYL